MEISYRVYTMDARGKILAAVASDFAGDEEAIAFAIDNLELWPAVEIWQTDRLIGRFSKSD